MIEVLARRGQAVTATSAVIDIALVLLKLGLGVLTGSLALISDAVHSGLDATASILAFVAVRSAAQPADREHPYGHGKAENLAAYTEGFLLVIAGLVIGYEAILHLVGTPRKVDANLLAIGFLVFTVVLEIARTTILRAVASRSNSASISALATDKLADLTAVTAVLIGLGAVRFGFAYGDSIAALFVAGLILWAAAQLIKQAVDVLMDRGVSAVQKQVLEAASGVEGVREARSARVRKSGAGLIGEVEIAGRPTLPLEAVQGLAKSVREAVDKVVPGLDLNVYVASVGDPTRLVERVHAIAARNGVFRDLHDVVVEQEANESLHLSLHAKLPRSTSMREATRLAKQLEVDLRSELPDVSRIDLHLEPLEPEIVQGRDVTAQHPALVETLRTIATSEERVLSCDDIELSSRGGGMFAYLKITVPDDLTLEQAHDIETALEVRIRQTEPVLKDVVVRALG
jgi:cation diffusion facilitator family transporter